MKVEELKNNFLNAVKELDTMNRIIVGYKQEYQVDDLIQLGSMCDGDSHVIEHKGKKYFIGHLMVSDGVNKGSFKNEDCVSRITFNQHLSSTGSSYAYSKGYFHKVSNNVIVEDEGSCYYDDDDDDDYE
jgi:hypothetical protein